MNLAEAITLTGIMIVLAAVPSTSVALVVVRSSTLGLADGIAVTAGILLGDLVFIMLALIGLSTIASMMGGFFAIVKYLGASYLLWLGYSLLCSKQNTSESVACNEQGGLAISFLAGFVLTLGDIKAIVFYASFLPVFIDLEVSDKTDIITLITIMMLSLGSVKIAYALYASRLATMASSQLRQTARKTAGLLMVGAGGYLIIKN